MFDISLYLKYPYIRAAPIIIPVIIGFLDLVYKKVSLLPYNRIAGLFSVKNALLFNKIIDCKVYGIVHKHVGLSDIGNVPEYMHEFMHLELGQADNIF